MSSAIRLASWVSSAAALVACFDACVVCRVTSSISAIETTTCSVAVRCCWVARLITRAASEVSAFAFDGAALLALAAALAFLRRAPKAAFAVAGFVLCAAAPRVLGPLLGADASAPLAPLFLLLLVAEGLEALFYKAGAGAAMALFALVEACLCVLSRSGR